MHLIDLKKPCRVLVLRLGALGDVADTIPAVCQLKKTSPQIEVDWVIKAGLEELVRPFSDQVIAFPKKRSQLKSFLQELRQHSYDLVLDFHANLRSALIGFAAKSSLRVGYDPSVSKEGARFFYTQTFRPPQTTTSRLDRGLWLASQVAQADFKPETLDFPETSEEAQKAQDILKEGHDVLVVSTMSPRGAFKSWPQERWRRFLKNNRGHQFLLLWGPGEEEQVRALARGLGSWVKVAPQVSLRQMLALLRRARVVVGSDTGPMHLAHLFGVPTVVLFGPKHPSQYGPQYNQHEVIYHQQACSPCRNWRCDHRSCMWSIGIDEVTKALSRLYR